MRGSGTLVAGSASADVPIWVPADTYDCVVSINDPSITDWLAAIGTVGTLGATVALFWIDRYQRRIREDKSQAALISGWTEPVRPGDATRSLKVANLSTEPIYRINVFVEDEFKRDDRNEVIPVRIGSGTINRKYISLLPPRQQVQFDLKRKEPISPGPRTCPRVYLLFDDRNGRRWARDFSGDLTSRRHDNPEDHRPIEPSARNDEEPIARSWIG
jgi:hypothetical protein